MAEAANASGKFKEFLNSQVNNEENWAANMVEGSALASWTVCQSRSAPVPVHLQPPASVAASKPQLLAPTLLQINQNPARMSFQPRLHLIHPHPILFGQKEPSPCLFSVGKALPSSNQPTCAVQISPKQGKPFLSQS
ncbi:hypothetical protein KSP39_PZI021337 [Platanthera zijinensis]|uniref:Uncharacterized protein n=1 Tax=Platanthera zijinensis TaxID=2320716 RepID=A0AAP0FW24_9ASPA